MAVTQNTYTGDGTTVLFSFTFPYLETTDIKVSLNGTVTTAYTLANATTIQFNAAPANGAAIRIYRQTDDAALAATFYPGSAIRSADLNENFTQNLYVTQESSNNATTATTTANTALTNSNTAISTANSAVSTANTASANASAAVSTANTASSNASAAVSTANTASSNATTAVNTANAATATANSASSTAATALSTANAATSTANAASTAATNAVNTANAASSAASSAVSTANTASTNASNAVTTANTASTNATTAVNTANTAVTTANAAAAAVANAVLYTTVANVAAIPASPANNTAIEVTNSTGIESFTPLSGLPVGFVGSSGLSVRIIYQTTGSTWSWIQYFPNDPETRYLKTGSTGTVTSTMIADGTIADSDINAAAAISLSKLATGALPTAITVASSNIVDGTIVNADINASAAIAGTKISPDFGSQTITTTGVISAAAGAAGTPSIAFTGDLNTGIYSPGADQVAISTNGTGRLLVDASGKVGVGTSSPSQLFHVNGNAVVGGSPAARYSTFTVAGDTAIQSGTPLLNFVNAAGSTRFGYIYHNGTGGNIDILNQENGGLTFGTNNAERLRITSAGLVGVGTSSPSRRLHVLASGTGNVATFESDAGPNLAFVGTEASGRTYLIGEGLTAAGLFQIYDNNASAARLTINSSGSVGIGTTAPNEAVTIATSTSASYIQICDNSTGTTSGDGLFIGSFNGAAEIKTKENNALQFGTNNTERARIDSSGRLLVGTSSSSGNHTAVLQGNSAGSGNAAVLAFRRNAALVAGNDIGVLEFSDNVNYLGARISAVGDGTWSQGTSHPSRLVFSTTADGASSPTERARITSDGVQCYNQATPVAKTAAATLTPAELKVGIITYSSASNANLTMPTGTDLEAAFPGIYTNMTFEFSLINLSSGTPSIAANTGITIVGGNNSGNSARFAVRRTAANTFTVYRLS